MPTILILDDDAADTVLIRRATADADYTVLTSQDLEEFCLQMAHQRIDLVVVSLATITEQDTPRFESILGQFPDTKVLAVAPAQREGGQTDRSPATLHHSQLDLASAHPARLSASSCLASLYGRIRHPISIPLLKSLPLQTDRSQVGLAQDRSHRIPLPIRTCTWSLAIHPPPPHRCKFSLSTTIPPSACSAPQA
jgi:CheY-like chemotaxis protein